jgi:serine/threonine protein kinase
VARNYTAQILCGLDYLHRHCIVHRSAPRPPRSRARKHARGPRHPRTPPHAGLLARPPPPDRAPLRVRPDTPRPPPRPRAGTSSAPTCCWERAGW